jgi:uncharacterized protein (TIGR02145 family)
MFNKKNKFNRFFLVFLLSLILGSVFLVSSSSVLAGDTFGTGFVEGEIALSSKDPRTMVSQIINVALSILSIIAVIIVIYGGFIWMTSEGSEEKVEKAKKILKAGVIGLAIILASWGIASFVLNKLGQATGTIGVSCEEGQVRPCGCEGISTCVDSKWGPCIGSSCGEGSHGSSCTAGLLGACLPDNTLCNTGLICNDNCKCIYPGEGDPCGETSPGSCIPDNDDCNNPNLICNDNCVCAFDGDDNYAELGDPCFDGGSCDADNQICNPNHGLTCDSSSCTCVGNPVITGFSPLGGFCNNNTNNPCSKDSDCSSGDTCNFTTPNTSSGNLFTILGYNFDTYDPNVSKVYFITTNNSVIPPLEAISPNNVNSYCDNSWTNTSITVALPGATSFVLGDDLEVEVVTKGNKKYNINENPQLSLVKWNVISRPGICAMDKNQGNLNEEIYYYGVNLQDGKAYFGNTVNNILAYAPQVFTSDTYGIASVPNLSSGKTSTFVQKSFNSIPVYSNFLDFEKIAEAPQGPSISHFNPMAGPSGQYVTITGTGFNSFKGSSSVVFRKVNDSSYSREANYSFPQVCAQSIWSDKEIIIKVPENIDDDEYELVVKIGDWDEVVANNFFTASSSMSLSPGLCKISPNSGPQKSPVSLWGEYFGNNSLAVFNVNKIVTSATISTDLGADKMVTAVPDNAITGPVKIKRDSDFSNSLNFLIASCGSNNDCDSGFCCLPGTPLAGACVSNQSDCFSDNPTNSAFQWGFTTGFSTSTPPGGDKIYSCASYNFCPTKSWTCPNMPGLCSPYDATGNLIETGACFYEYNCSNFGGFCGTNGDDCVYEESIDRCVQRDYECSLSKEVEYYLGYGAIKKMAICKDYVSAEGENRSYYEITVDTTCPNNWSLVPGTNNKCVDVASFGGEGSSCSSCQVGATCQLDSASNLGICVSPKLCSGNSVCSNDNICRKADTSSCQCCCEINKNLGPGAGNPACCYPLTCAYSCGISATAGSKNTDFGLCSGCDLAGNTQAEKDLACNCASVSGQYCEVNSQYPEGACIDCTSLSKDACLSHSTTCCWDEKNTICRGGTGDETVWGVGNQNIGYCPYYACDLNNPTLCNNLPVKNGEYSDIDSCGDGCGLNCTQINNESVCKDEAACCWNASTNKCLGGGEKYSNVDSDPNYGLCTYFNCVTAGSACTKGTTTTKYLDQNTCDNNCLSAPSGAGGPCSLYPGDFCSFGLCNIFSCLKTDGSLGEGTSPPSSCGVCCCSPSNDQCPGINSNLTCVADKGLCDGPSRGLCCGCSSDAECSPDGVDPEQVGCGFDSCCKARPKIETDTDKIADLSVFPEHTSDNICRNALIEINFDQRMDPLSLDDNILLLEESQGGSCSSGTYQISFSDEVYKKQKGFLAGVRKVFQKTIGFVAGLTGKTAVASPDSSKVYCAVLGLIDFVHDTSASNKTTVYFKSNNLLKPSTKYFVVVKGDEDLDSSSGVLSFDGVGMNGLGYYHTSIGKWEESNNNTNIKFGATEVYYTNSYIWEFTTLSVNTAGQGICEVDYAKVSPKSYLFQTSSNDINENDIDPDHSSFNSVRDRDTQYTARAYSSDNQLIRPTSEYGWTWEWGIANNKIFSFDNGVLGWNSDGDKRLIRVNSGITEGSSDITATVKMNSGNVSQVGDGSVGLAKAYFLDCRNPWPGFNDLTGLWEPWRDSGSFGDFNYELYYCRDYGSDDESDDLPAFLNDLAIIKGNSLIRVCSNLPSKTCSVNSDCPTGGLCLASFLKETYFFRETIDRFIKNVSLSDAATGGALSLSWESEKDLVTSYKVYYKLSGASTWMSKTIGLSNCTSSVDKYYCDDTLIGLTDGQEYNVYVVAVNNSVETNPSLTYSAIPTMPIPIFNNCGDLFHYNGYNYKTALVNGRCWFAEDLRTTKLNTGTAIQKIDKDADWSAANYPAYSWYQNSYNDFGVFYGALYNFSSVETEELCPPGWQVPNQQDFFQFVTFFGATAGGELKSVGVCGAASHPCWNAPNTGATNSSKMNIVSSGWRNNLGVFGYLNIAYSSWSRTKVTAAPSSAYYLRVLYNSASVAVSTQNKNFGMSVRCIKD